jgi:hypothetical protein
LSPEGDGEIPTARFKGESIAGNKIAYSFGKAIVASNGTGYAVSLGENGNAWVVRTWTPRTPGDEPPPQKFRALVARSADGSCEKKPKDEGKGHAGRHRERQGVLSGNASVVVEVPRHNVEHLQPQPEQRVKPSRPDRDT